MLTRKQTRNYITLMVLVIIGAAWWLATYRTESSKPLARWVGALSLAFLCAATLLAGPPR